MPSQPSSKAPPPPVQPVPKTKPKARSNGKHPGGRPPKLDDKTKERIQTALSTGAYKETAAALAGINKDTLYTWLRQGTEALRKAGWNLTNVPTSDRPYAEFSDFMEKAMREGEANLLTTVALASRPRPARTTTRTMPDGSKVTETVEAQDGHWQAAAWILERTRPDQYGRRDRMQLEGVRGGAPIVVEKVDVRAIKQVAVRDDADEGASS